MDIAIQRKEEGPAPKLDLLRPFRWARRHLSRLIPAIENLCSRYGQLADIPYRARFGILFVLVGALVFCGVEQGKDLLRQLILRHGTNSWPGGFALVAAVMLWATITWYFMRVRLSLLPAINPRTSHAKWEARWESRLSSELPRIAGAACFAVIGIAAHSLARADTPESPMGAGEVRMSYLYFPLAALFYVAVRIRRAILQVIGAVTPSDRSAMRRFAHELRSGSVKRARPVASVSDLAATSLTVLVVLFAMGSIPLVVFIMRPQTATVVGAPCVLLVSLSILTAFACFVGYLSDLSRAPLGTALFLIFALSSRFNDNHAVRTVEPTSTTPATLADAARTRLGADGRRGGRIPVFLAYAEGGGIRAAYWTAAVLGELEDENDPGTSGTLSFSQRLFAISGVSGGSLGAAVFVALRSEPSVTFSDCGPFGRHVCAAKRVLGQDFLAPPLATMLFPDLLQRFLPVNCLPDRASALEGSWERSWKQATGRETFSNHYRSVWRGDNADRIPNVFFNATWAERGSRVVVSNLDSQDAFLDSTALGDPFPLSAAVHLSARFPGISPAGTIGAKHVVDGGYFENSGAATLSEVLDALLDGPEGSRVWPVIIGIHNNGRDHTPTPARWLSELVVPLDGLYRTGEARARLADRALMKRMGGSDPDHPFMGESGAYLPFNLDTEQRAIPLGWTLSGASMEVMDQQIKDVGCSRKAVTAILRALRGEAIVDDQGCPSYAPLREVVRR